MTNDEKGWLSGTSTVRGNCCADQQTKMLKDPVGALGGGRLSCCFQPKLVGSTKLSEGYQRESMIHVDRPGSMSNWSEGRGGPEAGNECEYSHSASLSL